MQYSIPQHNLTSFVQSYKSTIGICAAIWLLFATMQVAKNLFFSRADIAIWFYTLEAVYLFLPWFFFSIGCGLLIARSSAFAGTGLRTLSLHGLVALLLALSHIAIITASYWLFWPQIVVRVTVGFVFVEQFLKWFAFELLAYAAVLLLWRWRFRISAELAPIEQPDTEKCIVIATDEATLRVNAADIDWLQADDNYVCVFAKGKEIRTRSTLKAMLEKLPAGLFFQTHRSAAVNLKKVHHVDKVRVELESGFRVPVSRRKYKLLLERIKTDDDGQEVQLSPREH